jgi:D-sedoheptulose 7-phosphate isomerase
MTDSETADRTTSRQRVESAFARREAPLAALAAEAEAVARACRAMAARFHRGGKLIVFGNGGGSSDAQHVAVEFMHPVVVGKRALPAVALTSDAATMTGVAQRVGFAQVFAHQLRRLAAGDDMALGFSADGRCENVRRGLEQAHEMGLLTVALVGADGGPLATSGAVQHVLRAHAADPRVVKEVHVTMYHVLWELVHVFLEQPGALQTAQVRP